MRRVDDAGVEHLAGRIDDGDLAAGAVSGVEADGYAALDRRLHQELAQVERKDADRVLVRLFGQLAADLALDGGEDQAAVAVERSFFHGVAARRAGLHERAGHDLLAARGVEFERNLQKALAFAAVEREHAVPGDFGGRLGKFVVHAVDRVLVLGGAARDDALRHRGEAQPAAHGRVVRDDLGDDVLRAGERVLRRFNALFGVDEILGHVDRVGGAFLLREDFLRERLESACLGNAGARLALRAVGAVDVVDFGERRGLVECGGDFIGQAAGVFDQPAHFLAAAVQPAQVLEPLENGADRLVVEGAVLLLAVARDERDRVARVDQLDQLFGLSFFQVELRGERGCVICHIDFQLSVHCVKCSVFWASALQSPCFFAILIL